VREGPDTYALVLDTETLTLTEAGETSGIFRSGGVVVTDTVKPVVGDGVVSWGKSDTMHVAYTDPNDGTDTGADTALGMEIATSARVVFYEDQLYGDEVDTFLTRDLVYVAVHDTDENRNPQMRDTVQVVVVVGNAGGHPGPHLPISLPYAPGF